MTITQTTRGGQRSHDAQSSPAATGTDSPADHRRNDAQTCDVGGGTDTETTRGGHEAHDAHRSPAAVGLGHRPDHGSYDAQGTDVGPVPLLPQVRVDTAPKPVSPAGSSSGSSQPRHDTHRTFAAAGAHSPADQTRYDAQQTDVGGGTGRNRSAATNDAATPKAETSLADPFLALAADVLDDAEATRKANENRLRQLTRSEADKDGIERGFGLDETHPDVARLAALVDMLRQVEHQAELNLARLLRQHPLGAWVKAQKGIGEKQAARLLAVIGDPYMNEQTGQPRTVSQLWAYCGHGDPARRKFRGMSQADLFALGNPVAKSRVWLIATAVLKAQGPLVSVYYDRKAATEGRLHAAPCVRCGPSGHPAAEGTPWSDAHRHADALRVLGKHILRELWLEAQRIHDEQDPR